jgi:hypothetical protein
MEPAAAVTFATGQIRQLGDGLLARSQRSERMRLVSGVFGFRQPRFVFWREPGLAAAHSADHESFRIDGCPAGQLGTDHAADHADRRRVQLTDPESRSGQRRDVPSSAACPLLPHRQSMWPAGSGRHSQNSGIDPAGWPNLASPA